MASLRKSMAVLFYFLLVLLCASMVTPASALQFHKVGDAAGWTDSGNVDYSAWASSKSFKVGDAIVFEYERECENVMQVSRDDYITCMAASPIQTLSSGIDIVPIQSEGHYYYISGVPGHCDAGQRVDIKVSGDGPRSPSTAPFSSLTFSKGGRFRVVMATEVVVESSYAAVAMGLCSVILLFMVAAALRSVFLS